MNNIFTIISIIVLVCVSCAIRIGGSGSRISAKRTTPTYISILSDGSSLIAGQFVVENYNITASDGSSSKINCPGLLHQTASGSSSVTDVAK